MQVILAYKLFALWLYHGMVSFVFNSVAQAAITGIDGYNDVFKYALVLLLILFFMFGIMLPEFCLVRYPAFKEWIKQGVEDSDGKLNKSDMQDALMLYSSLWAMRAFMAFTAAIIFGIDIPPTYYFSALFPSHDRRGRIAK